MSNLTFREKFGWGDARKYRERYDCLQICRGSAFYFITKVLKKESINVNYFNITEMNLLHRRYCNDKTSNDLSNPEINKLDTLNLINFYSSSCDGFKWYSTTPFEAAEIKTELLTDFATSTFPAGTIHLRDHAMAYACDKKSLFVYDPVYGLLRFARDLSGVNDFFSMINERRNLCNLSMLALRKPVNIIKP
ncbi:hypothetical protein [Pantoea sp. SO10]|uniref:hypothetical protein n=1 Tax=Pantoea sp. SO10 TaxID=2575375 RepID=UPI0010C9C287|nr:hypothetical protein [Pantoea sp. SO10]QCP59338.1 hypothetical protein FCN45_08105 [Pantoea sp. SO10]